MGFAPSRNLIIGRQQQSIKQLTDIMLQPQYGIVLIPNGSTEVLVFREDIKR